MTTQEILSRLEGVRKSGEGWMARCPAHHDRKPSLSIGRGDAGKILLHCQANCTTESVCAALDVELKDLFEDMEPRIVAEYPYTDEGGKLLYQVVRYEPKNFRQRRPDGSDGWIWSLNGTRRVIFNLSGVLKAKAVLVCEGEKDCEAAARLGFVATCNAGGAGKWRDEYSASLQGKRIVIIPDADEPGRRHAQQVAASLHGKAESVKVLELPNAKDLTEWFERGGTREAILGLIKNCKDWETDGSSEIGVVLRTFADIAPESVRWLWCNRIPIGHISLLIGEPDLGKSLLTVDIAARVSRGLPFPDGSPCEVASVIILSAEDGSADTIRPRLDAVGADVSRVYWLDAVRVRLADGTVNEKGFSLDVDIAALDARLRQNENIRLIIIDPISAYLGRTDSHRNAEVRGILSPLKELAERRKVAILGMSHFRKSGGTALQRSIDSIAFVAAARVSWGVAIHPEDPSLRVMLKMKNNLAPDIGGLTFGIEAPNGTPRIKWGDAVSLDANAILGGNDNREENSRLDDAIAWLADFLSEGGIPSSEVKRKAIDAGHTWTTIERAKSRLGIKPRKSGFGKEGTWLWELPAKDSQPRHKDLTALDKITENTPNNHEPFAKDSHLTALSEAHSPGPPPTPISCAVCGELQPSRVALSHHLESHGGKR